MATIFDYLGRKGLVTPEQSKALAAAPPKREEAGKGPSRATAEPPPMPPAAVGGKAMRAEPGQVREEWGEWTEHEIRPDRYKDLIERLKARNRASEKLGLGPTAEWRHLGTRWISLGVLRSKGSEHVRVPREILELREKPLVISGWMLVAEIVDDEGIRLVKEKTAVPCPEEYRERNRTCDQCGLTRERKHTFVLLHEDGRWAHVGSTCVKDFLGHDPAAFAAASAGVLEEDESEGSEEDDYGSGKKRSGIEIKDFLERAVAAIRLKGFSSREQGGPNSTASLVINSYGKEIAPKDRIKVEDRDREKAVSILAYFREDRPGKRTTFESNMDQAMRGEVVTDLTAGLVAFSPVVYDKARSREAQGAGEYVGTLNESGFFVVDCEYVGKAGRGTIVVLNDELGNTIDFWLTAKNEGRIVAGNKYVVMGTVTEHKEYNKRKQTWLSRVDVVSDLGPSVGPFDEYWKEVRAIVLGALARRLEPGRGKGQRGEEFWQAVRQAETIAKVNSRSEKIRAEMDAYWMGTLDHLKGVARQLRDEGKFSEEQAQKQAHDRNHFIENMGETQTDRFKYTVKGAAAARFFLTYAPEGVSVSSPQYERDAREYQSDQAERWDRLTELAAGTGSLKFPALIAEMFVTDEGMYRLPEEIMKATVGVRAEWEKKDLRERQARSPEATRDLERELARSSSEYAALIMPEAHAIIGLWFRQAEAVRAETLRSEAAIWSEGARELKEKIYEGLDRRVGTDWLPASPGEAVIYARQQCAFAAKFDPSFCYSQRDLLAIAYAMEVGKWARNTTFSALFPVTEENFVGLFDRWLETRSSSQRGVEDLRGLGAQTGAVLALARWCRSQGLRAFELELADLPDDTAGQILARLAASPDKYRGIK